MHGYRVFSLILALTLGACGGGGGGSSGPVSPTGSITLDTQTVSVSALTSEAAPSGTINVSISITGTGTPIVTATSTTSGIASVTTVVDSASHATLTIHFKDPAQLGAGTYNDTLTIKACFDANCAQSLSGSPASVATHYTVVAPAGSISLDTSAVSVSVPATASAPTSKLDVSIALTGGAMPTVTATTTNTGVASVSTVLNSATRATLTIAFKSPSQLGAGTYDDSVTLTVCADPGCTSPVTGSPATVSVHYVVTAAQSGSPGSVTLDRQVVSASAPTTGTAPSGSVNATITLAAAGTPQVSASSTNSGIASVSAVVNGANAAIITIAFKSPSALAPATYDDVVTITACADVACTQPLSGSPATVTTHFTVTAPATVTLSGTLTFDKVPGNITGIGLNYAGTTPAPARGVLVEAVLVSDRTTVAASASSNASGNFSLSVPSNTNLFLRAKAEMLRTGTPGWHFRVLDNTSSDALYALTGADFNSGVNNSQRNLNAPSGWNGTSYASTRAAAPFAILDVAYKAYNLVLGANATANFPDLDLFWSKNNKAVSPFNAANGDIETTLFNPAIPANGTKASIYILGDANVDTDEYDDSVIAHEWGHYFQDSFSRDDSFGGLHVLSDRLDLRVAFSEGWGDGFSGMATGKSVYQDAQDVGQAGGSCIGLESNSPVACGVPQNLGWYNEVSIARVLYDFYDSVNDGVDSVSLGFGPIYTVMNNEIKTTRALTSIYSFSAALKSRNASAAAGIDAILNAQNIASADPSFDEFGSGETNNAGDPSVLPVYIPISSPGTASNVCSNSNFGYDDKLGVSKFLKLTLSAPKTVTITVTFTGNPPSTSDPDIELYDGGTITSAESATVNRETLTKALQAGTYIVEVFEFANLNTPPKGNTCFTVSIN